MEVPENLRQAFEAAGDMACVAVMVNGVASIVIKSRPEDLALWRGKRPVGLQPRLFQHEAGAVMALKVTIYEPGGARFEADSVLNVAEPFDLALLKSLAGAKEWHLHFFDQNNRYDFSKSLPFRSRYRQELRRMVRQAVEHNQRCAKLNWAEARAAYMEIPL